MVLDRIVQKQSSSTYACLIYIGYQDTYKLDSTIKITYYRFISFSYLKWKIKMTYLDSGPSLTM